MSASNKSQLAIGLGCQADCSAEALRALIDASLAEQGLSLAQVGGLACIERRRDTPGLHALAAELGLPLVFFTAAQLQPFDAQLSHRSALAFKHTGCHGVAESAALALAAQLNAGTARLLIPYRKSRQATFALAGAG